MKITAILASSKTTFIFDVDDKLIKNKDGQFCNELIAKLIQSNFNLEYTVIPSHLTWIETNLVLDNSLRMQALELMIDEIQLNTYPEDDGRQGQISDVQILLDNRNNEPEDFDWFGLWSGKKREQKTLPFSDLLQTNIYVEDNQLHINVRFFGTKAQLQHNPYEDADHFQYIDMKEPYFEIGYIVKTDVAEYPYIDLVVVAISNGNGWCTVNTNSGETKYYYKS